MPAPIAELPLHIDSTMMSCFRSCPQKFYLEFILGLRPTGLSVDLHAGACFASALENVYIAHYRDGRTLEHSLAVAHGAYLQQWGDFVPLKDTPKSKERVWEAVEEYFKVYGLETDQVQPYFVDGKPSMEFTFAIPLGPENDRPVWSDVEPPAGFPLHPSGQPFIYAGRLDLLGHWVPAKKFVGRDEKTTTSIGASWADQWSLRSQFKGYCWALQQFGLPVDTICVRGIGILKTKFTIGHEAEAFKTYSRWEIARWHEQLRRDLWRLRRAWDEGYWDWNLGDSCNSWGGCTFRDLCTSEHPERWFAQFSQKRWNPLLKNPTEAPSA